MRWKWRLGLLLMALIEIPILLWAAAVAGIPLDILLYLAGILTVVFLVLLALRPILFGITGVWLGGIAVSAWYFLRFLSPGIALAFGAILSTLACAVGSPVYFRTLAFVLRRHV